MKINLARVLNVTLVGLLGIFLAAVVFPYTFQVDRESSSSLATKIRASNILKSFFFFFPSSSNKRGLSTTTIATVANMTTANNTNTTTPTKRTPVYFFSHGGPNIMYDTAHPVYPRLQALGKEITTLVRPKAIVVFSAHWQADFPNTIEVNAGINEPLLYDYYGFPRHYYLEKYPNVGDPALANKVMGVLGDAGIKAVGVERGLDHGVFAVFKVAFDPEKNPVGVPIVQVSLFSDDTDAEAHIKLGRALEGLREEGVLIIVSGMAVHNLRHLRMTMGDPTPMPYTLSFDEALREAVEAAPGEERDRKMVGLLSRKDARLAHPTFEHLLPAHVGVGAAERIRAKGYGPWRRVFQLGAVSMG